MPSIREQTVLPDGFEVIFTGGEQHKILFREETGNDVTMFAYIDYALVREEYLNNPTIDGIYDWVAQWAFPGGEVDATDKGMMHISDPVGLWFAWKLIQRKPLQLNIMASNSKPPANWWQ